MENHLIWNHQEKEVKNPANKNQLKNQNKKVIENLEEERFLSAVKLDLTNPNALILPRVKLLNLNIIVEMLDVYRIMQTYNLKKIV